MKAGNPFNLQAPNPSYIGNLLVPGIGTNGALNLFDPNYKTPRSLQLNVGIQHEIRHGMVFSADYLRNVETRTLAGIDVNRAGDASIFNLAGAQAAIAATNSSLRLRRPSIVQSARARAWQTTPTTVWAARRSTPAQVARPSTESGIRALLEE